MSSTSSLSWELGRKSVARSAALSARMVGSMAASIKEQVITLTWSPIVDTKRSVGAAGKVPLALPASNAAYLGEEQDWELSTDLKLRLDQPVDNERLSSGGDSRSTRLSSLRLSERFVTQTALEDKIIKEKLEKARVRKSIVQVVADGDALSEML